MLHFVKHLLEPFLGSDFNYNSNMQLRKRLTVSQADTHWAQYTRNGSHCVFQKLVNVIIIFPDFFFLSLPQMQSDNKTRQNDF